MKVLIVALTLTIAGCASKAPPSLSPEGAVIWAANEAVVAINVLQHAAIELNRIQICEPAPCRPLLSLANTKIVVDAADDGRAAIRQIPAGWRATTIAVMDRVEQRLDAAGLAKLRSYVAAAREIVKGL